MIWILGRGGHRDGRADHGACFCDLQLGASWWLVDSEQQVHAVFATQKAGNVWAKKARNNLNEKRLAANTNQISPEDVEQTTS